MPHAATQNKGPSTSILTAEETSHEESSCLTRMTSNSSNNMPTATAVETSLDESRTQEKSESEQEVYINSTSLS